MLLPLVEWDEQGIASHWSAHVGDTVALELGSLLPWIFSLQELFGLAILLEQHVCVTLGRIQVAVDCPNYERSTWASFHAREFSDSDILSEGIVPISATRSFLNLVPKWENVYHRFDILLRPSTDGTVAIWLPSVQSFWQFPSVTSRRSWGSYLRALTNSLAIAVVQKAFWIFGSDANWDCHWKSLWIKNSTQNKSCQRTAPKHPFDFCWKATAQVHLFAHATLEVFPDPPCLKVFLVCSHLLERWTNQYW